MGTRRIRTCRAMRTRRRTRATWPAAHAGVTCPPRPATAADRHRPSADRQRLTTQRGTPPPPVADERDLAMARVRPTGSDL